MKNFVDSLLGKFGKMIYFLYALLIFAWGISVRDHIVFGGVAGLYGIGALTLIYVAVFTVDYFKKK